MKSSLGIESAWLSWLAVELLVVGGLGFGLLVVPANSGLAQGNSQDDLYTRAWEHFEAGRVEAAIEDCNRALELGEDALIYGIRAQCYQEREDWNPALSDYAKAIELDPSESTFFYNRGMLRQEAGDPEGALFDYWRFIEADPEDPDGYLRRAMVFREMGAPHLALADYRKLLEIHPHSADAFQARGECACEGGDYEEGLEDLDRAISLSPDDVSHYYSRAWCRSVAGDERGAIADFGQVLEREPDSAYAYLNRGIAWDTLEQWEAAIADFDAVTRLDPDDPNSYGYRGETLRKVGNTDEALSEFAKAIALDDHHEARVYRGRLLNQLGRRDEALEDFSHLIVSDPERPDLYYERGKVWAQLQARDRAMEDFDRALDLYFGFGEAYVARGRLYAEMDQDQRAVREFCRAIDSDPNDPDPEILLDRARCYAELGSWEQAEEDCRRALEARPDLVDARLLRAESARREGEWKRALEDLDRAVEIAPENPRVYLERAGILTHLGRLEAARVDGLRAAELRKADEGSGKEGMGFVESSRAGSSRAGSGENAAEGSDASEDAAKKLLESYRRWTERYCEKLAGYRDLKFSHPVEPELVSRDMLKREIERLAEQQTPEEALADHLAYVHFGFFELSPDFQQESISLSAEEIAGFYDPDLKALLLVDDGREKKKATGRSFLGRSLLGRPPSPKPGDLTEAQKALLCHELTHALADQHFDLNSMLQSAESDDDLYLAIESLVEGEAMITMILDSRDGNRKLLSLPSGLVSVFEFLGELAAPFSGGDSFGEASLLAQEELLFPYFKGLAFCLTLTRQEGNWRLIDRAYGDPPLSTEQILHPEKYLGEARDVPLDLVFSGGKNPLDSEQWRLIDQNGLGELRCRVLLAPTVGGARSRKAAAGWDGDRYLLFRRALAGPIALGRDPETLMVWLSTWDEENDAEEFAEALVEVFFEEEDRTPSEGLDAALQLIEGQAGLSRHRVWMEERGLVSGIWSRAKDVWKLSRVPQAELPGLLRWSLEVEKKEKKFEKRFFRPRVPFPSTGRESR